MRMRFHILFFAVLLGLLPTVAAAQEEGEGVTAEIYYLMPEFGQGMIWFSNQGPAEGKLNICAEDNTLRYLDKNGQEIVAASIDNVVKVQIDTVVFIRNEGVSAGRLRKLLPNQFHPGIRHPLRRRRHL